ncbi:MAG: Lrp/AsnC family transcriptional regulator, partial [Gammaproteobacteria bacterium]|nr:Lrp/AsnC family transcriptional regulator [Gammaproteobacteria bacterium]
QVSHCYERKVNPLWQYNLFAMIHGHSKEECRKVAEKVMLESGLNNYVMLFSTREIKKTRIKYPV